MRQGVNNPNGKAWWAKRERERESSSCTFYVLRFTFGNGSCSVRTVQNAVKIDWIGTVLNTSLCGLFLSLLLYQTVRTMWPWTLQAVSTSLGKRGTLYLSVLSTVELRLERTCPLGSQSVTHPLSSRSTFSGVIAGGGGLVGGSSDLFAYRLDGNPNPNSNPNPHPNPNPNPNPTNPTNPNPNPNPSPNPNPTITLIITLLTLLTLLTL